LRRGPLTLASLTDQCGGGKVETFERYLRRYPKLFTKVNGSDGITRIALVENRVEKAWVE
jgi:hypothetical protein